jgi:uncharacterized membrane protein
MADLIVISFDTETQAEAAYTEILRLETDLVVEVAGLALVKVDDHGKTHVETPDPAGKVGVGAAGGALFGTLLGLLFFVPLAGLVLGGLIGGLVAGLDKTGLDSEFRERVRSIVSTGKSAVVIYAIKITEDKFTKALAPFNGTIVQTSLSEEDEHAMAHDLANAK